MQLRIDLHVFYLSCRDQFSLQIKDNRDWGMATADILVLDDLSDDSDDAFGQDLEQYVKDLVRHPGMPAALHLARDIRGLSLLSVFNIRLTTVPFAGRPSHAQGSHAGSLDTSLRSG